MEEKVTERVSQQTMKAQVQELYCEAVEQQKQGMYDKFIDKICYSVQENISSRIIHEIVCLFEVSTLSLVADNMVSMVSEQLFGSIVELYVVRENRMPPRRLKVSTKAPP